ncbi:MAG: hypothetical protein K2X45_04265 [Phreatobacter sp.]|nr:hypothetical protein [Phreatobacter sp.]
MVFVDFDGVLTTDKDKLRMGSQTYLHPAQVGMLNDIVDPSGAVVVVSSTWRFDSNTPQILRAAGFTGAFHPDGWRTGPYRDSRGDELVEALRVFRPARFVFLDDDPSVPPMLKAHHVQPDPSKGLGPLHVDDALFALSLTPDPRCYHGVATAVD